MKTHPKAIFFEDDRRAASFYHPAANRDEQRLDARPFYVAANRLREYSFKSFAVLAIHVRMISCRREVQAFWLLRNRYDSPEFRNN